MLTRPAELALERAEQLTREADLRLRELAAELAARRDPAPPPEARR